MIKRLIPWIFIAAAVGTMVGLGSWQLHRLQWKENLLAQYEAGQTLPELMLESIPSTELTSHAYRRIQLSGTFLHDKEIHLGGRRWHGKTGYHLVTPLKTADERIFLVNRGWIPFEKKDTAERPSSLTEGTVTLSAILRIPKPPQYLTPENHPEKNFWFSIDFPAIETFIALKPEPVLLEVVEATPDINKFPIVSDGKRVFRNDHLGYAITWYALAVAAFVIFLIQKRRSGLRQS